MADEFDGPVSPDHEPSAAAEQAARKGEDEAPVEIFDGVRGHDGNPILPVKLKEGDMFAFSCHKGISCWNECCHGADIVMTPGDMLRLSRHFGIRPIEFLDRYCYQAQWDKAGLPVAKLRMTGEDGSGPCQFVDDETGCTVYENRPVTCRYYPLGLAAIKMKGQETKDSFNFLVKESHCKGHDESKLLSVGQFRKEQGTDEYDQINSGWMDILMKAASWASTGGPYGKEISAKTQGMFYMVSTDIDAFRRFVLETRFLEIYQIDPETIKVLKTNDSVLLLLGFDWLKNVIYGEPTISMKESVLQEGIAKTRNELGAS
ncbi:MAG: YkgJ family cysteine cluster protein [Proteobacteria bacterium]|nr:YkgJ family cysteine cluster protein [Pseudomonadota bacterium]